MLSSNVKSCLVILPDLMSSDVVLCLVIIGSRLVTFDHVKQAWFACEFAIHKDDNGFLCKFLFAVVN